MKIPDLHVVGANQLFIRIARNKETPIGHLMIKETRRALIDNALLGLGLRKGSFDHDTSLVWLRWSRKMAWDRSRDLNFVKTVGRYYRYLPRLGEPAREGGEIPWEMKRIVMQDWEEGPSLLSQVEPSPGVFEPRVTDFDDTDDESDEEETDEEGENVSADDDQAK